MRSVSNLVVPLGHVRFVLFDAREGSPSYGVYDDVTIGVTHYSMLSIPPGVVYAWRTVGEETAMVVNCATELWAPDESTNQPLDTYTYSWE